MQRFCSKSIGASHCHFLNTALQKNRRKLFLCTWEKIIGLSENSSWKGLQEVSAVQASAKIGVNYGIRPSSLGLYPVRPWKSPRERTPSLCKWFVAYVHYGIMFSVYGFIGHLLLCLLISFYLLKQLESL